MSSHITLSDGVTCNLLEEVKQFKHSSHIKKKTNTEAHLLDENKIYPIMIKIDLTTSLTQLACARIRMGCREFESRYGLVWYLIFSKYLGLSLVWWEASSHQVTNDLAFRRDAV